MKLCTALIIICGVFGGCSFFNRKFNLNDDNIIEEAIEKNIENYTGFDVDLTPHSVED